MRGKLHITDMYNSFELSAYSAVDKETGKSYFWWAITKDGDFIQKDYDTLSGDKLQSDKQAINEAKKTIDAWARLRLI